MKRPQMLICVYLLLATALCQASVVPAVVPSHGVALAQPSAIPTVPAIVPVATSHQFFARYPQRAYVPTLAWPPTTVTKAYPAYPAYPTYPTYGSYPTTYYKYGSTYPYPYGGSYYPSYNYGYSYTGGIW